MNASELIAAAKKCSFALDPNRSPIERLMNGALSCTTDDEMAKLEARLIRGAEKGRYTYEDIAATADRLSANSNVIKNRTLMIFESYEQLEAAAKKLNLGQSWTTDDDVRAYSYDSDTE